MSSETKLTQDEDGEFADDTKYRGMIGSLLYLTASQPDIMFSVCLWYPKGKGVETILYVDSDHAGDDVDLKSISGVCTFMGCCLTSWFTKKQTALAISTTEAEYVSAEKACQQALWMKQDLVDYDIKLDDMPVLCDNKGAIDLIGEWGLWHPLGYLFWYHSKRIPTETPVISHVAPMVDTTIVAPPTGLHTSPFICTDSLETSRDPSDGPPSQDPYEAILFGRPYCTHPNGPRKVMNARKRVGPLLARRLAWRRASPRSSDHHSSPGSSSDASLAHASGHPTPDQSLSGYSSPATTIDDSPTPSRLFIHLL
ncbi:hypothetical protein Tco_0441906 [Tanacetum coccineum]